MSLSIATLDQVFSETSWIFIAFLQSPVPPLAMAMAHFSADGFEEAMIARCRIRSQHFNIRFSPGLSNGLTMLGRRLMLRRHLNAEVEDGSGRTPFDMTARASQLGVRNLGLASSDAGQVVFINGAEDHTCGTEGDLRALILLRKNDVDAVKRKAGDGRPLKAGSEPIVSVWIKMVPGMGTILMDIGTALCLPPATAFRLFEPQKTRKILKILLGVAFRFSLYIYPIQFLLWH
ncbi:hypothetical protein GGX14DRAFT_648015 [Mycena pura]|uniref:Uncharacterized protein n=1 Tax=Mycena pura TaxID=153505 RepID=A0AAD6V5Z9_9AGAR|nr:hypothetical protein GGX14DRAFT_648015 [Mycena pura]